MPTQPTPEIPQPAPELLDVTQDLAHTGIVIVDHGSRREASNLMLEQFVELFVQLKAQYPIVEPAHMEIARPSIADAVARCVERGARRVAVCPYFLAPGKHWHKDIPELTQAACVAVQGKTEAGVIPWVVTAPIGLMPLMADVIENRLTHCLLRASGKAGECDSCAGTGRCRLHEGEQA